MEKIKNKKALSLSELLISSVLISIVMLGVVVFNFSVRQAQNSTSSISEIKTKTASAMLQIKKDAQLAVGDATDPGIISFSGTASKRCICFRQDVNDPSSYTDDQWICYPHGSSYGIWRVLAAVQPTSYATCKENFGGNVALPFSYSLSISDFYNIATTTDSDGVSHIDYVDITLSTASDTSTAPNVDCSDPINNPCYSLTTQISPIGHSR